MGTQFFMAAPHAAGKGEDDPIFAVAQKAGEAAARLGQDKVVNATIGAIYDDTGKFAALSTVSEYYRQMSDEDLMNYAPISGLPDFLQAAIDNVFQGFQPQGTYAKAVATPGGTGAVHHIIYNYLEQGQKALIPDWYWGTYQTIADENHRSVDTYRMFDENYSFTTVSIKEKSREILKVQDNLVSIFNTPAHNPTGYSMTVQDWKEVLDFYRECAQDPKKKIIIAIDMAYLDYAGPARETREFLGLFGNLPKNILITIAFSMSKTFLVYGMRSGALIGLSSSPEVAEEFFQTNAYSNRATWSNGSRGAQKLLADVARNSVLKEKIDRERDGYYQLIKNRADIFLKESAQVGLQILPYRAGFFITVPAVDPRAAAENLSRANVYAVALKKGVRFAVCAIPTFQMAGLATKMKEALK